MWETGKTIQIALEMRRYDLAVLGISETHWTQAGQKRLATGEMLLYSGHEEDNAPHTQGVALMLSKLARNALVGWESHGSRIIKASFKTKKEGILMNIIQCYAPTNDSNDDIKDQFFERLQSVIEKCPRKDLTILMGDLNAKVGIDNTGYEDIMGRHGLGERNENGERFANLCAFNKLVIGGTIFPHKRIHKATWISPDHTTENQIDHICINKKFRRTMEDELLNRPASMNPPDTKAAHTDLPIDVNPPTKEEIKMAVRQIKNGKAAGPDNIPAEALKSDIEASEKKHRIQWTAQNQLDDLDFADDLALLSRTHEQMQMKTASVAAVFASVGLSIHKGKSKVLKFKAENSSSITLDGKTLEDVESFTYLGSTVDEQGGSDANVKARIGKARTAFLQLKNVWNLKQLSTNIKVRIFNTNVKTVLLYGAETWRTTTTTIKKVQVFVNSCLRKILNIHFPDTISNSLLW
ncbi:unnamed protein product [Schistosoma margrebowiei]|uniref:Uncharacterized protein n=1 Tax=Schistosoma margrebowiei TaxID=48269 RepID=A0A183NA56_9TREM|nr:unnamed protein product [Schistosoma margrebowiei]